MKAKIGTYINQIKSGKAKTDKEAILEALKDSYLTKNDLIRLLKKTHSTITARLSDLHDEGKIKEVCSINKDATILTLYRLSRTNEKEKIIKKRELERINRSINYLETKGYKIIRK